MAKCLWEKESLVGKAFWLIYLHFFLCSGIFLFTSSLLKTAVASESVLRSFHALAATFKKCKVWVMQGLQDWTRH